MSWTAPTPAQFKATFNRDFPYAPATDANNLNFITDGDIQKAIDEGQILFSSGLFGGDANATIIFMYLAAHTLVMNIRNSQSGLSSLAKFPLESTGAGGVSLTNNINERFAGDPIFSGLLKTGYGQKYLDMVYPFTVGNVQNSCGDSTFA